MSALAMILTAAMVAPGDAPEKVSGEMAAPQRLDLRGDWGQSSTAEMVFIGAMLVLAKKDGLSFLGAGRIGQ